MSKARVDNEEHDAAIDIMLDEGSDEWAPVDGKALPGLDKTDDRRHDDHDVEQHQ